MTLGAELFAAPLCSLFVGYDAALLEKTVSGFHKFALSFFLMGFVLTAWFLVRGLSRMPS